MGKRASTLAAVVVALAGVLAPRGPAPVRAQTPSGCNGQVSASAMPGRYTGAWQTTGQYHFYVFNTDVTVGLTITGTLDLQLDPGGAITGVARGDVQAPVTRDGRQDVSSGTGTISGTISGTVTATGGALTLSQPVIDMRWGTFLQGYTVERYIQMPDFTFTLSGQDCVRLNGAIAENGFPVQTLVADGTPNITQAPGVGGSSGTWNLQNTDTATFDALSAQIDAFIATANATLASPSAGSDAVQSQVVAPLAALLARINAHPDIAGCLMERLAAWQATVTPGLLRRADELAARGDLASERQAGDLVRAVRTIAGGCAVAGTETVDAIDASLGTSLDGAIAAGRWGEAALTIREMLLTRPDGGPALATRIAGDLRALIAGATTSTGLHDAARMAYALGDDADAGAAYRRILSMPGLVAHATKPARHGKKKHHRKRVPKPKPTVTPTPTAPPPTLSEVLAEDIRPMTATGMVAAAPAFTWQSIPGAQRYLVAVTADGATSSVLWTWAGAGTSVRYGDSALDGVPGSTPAWPLSAAGATWHWSVLALDGQGRIIGAALRLPAPTA